MIWVPHVKNLVFNKVPNRLPHGVMVHTGAKHINAVKTRFTVFVSIHLCDELYKEVRFSTHAGTYAKSENREWGCMRKSTLPTLVLGDFNCTHVGN